MAYNPDVTFDEMAADLALHIPLLVNVAADGLEKFRKYEAVATDAHARLAQADAFASLAAQFTANGRTTTSTEVAQLASAYAALKAVYDVLNNVDVAQSDYMYALRKFG